MSNPSPTFLKLFKAEIENRAFALYATDIMLKRSTKPDDVLWYGTWLKWEDFHQHHYAPVAKKYGLSQSPSFLAKARASAAAFAAYFVPENVIMKSMLEQTKKYCQQLSQLQSIAPIEDKDFFAYVLEQEQVQVVALPLRIEGRSKDGALLLETYMESHSKRSSIE